MLKYAVSPFSNTYAPLEPKKQKVHDNPMTIKASPFNAIRRSISGGKEKKEAKQ